MRHKKILITGGSGFLGVEFLRYANNENYRVINLDLVKPKKKSSIITLGRTDLSDAIITSEKFNRAAQIMGGIDYIFNLASKVSYTTSYKNLFETNVRSAFNVTHECAKYGSSLIHMSGTAIHGHVDRAIRETDLFQPIENYGKSKAEAEKEIFRISKNKKVKSLVFRSTAPIGPGLDNAGINEMYKMVMNEPILPASKGSKVSYVSTRDIAKAFFFAAENFDMIWKEPETLSDNAFNLAVPQAFSDRESIEYLVKTIHGDKKKKIIEISPHLIHLGSYFIQGGNSIQNLFRKNKKEPKMAVNLAKLMKGPHYQDMGKFEHIFQSQIHEQKRFKFDHPTPQDVLDQGTVYKFQTEWENKEPTNHIKNLMIT